MEDFRSILNPALIFEDWRFLPLAYVSIEENRSEFVIVFCLVLFKFSIDSQLSFWGINGSGDPPEGSEVKDLSNSFLLFCLSRAAMLLEFREVSISKDLDLLFEDLEPFVNDNSGGSKY
jgi:hypothetical protein